MRKLPSLNKIPRKRLILAAVLIAAAAALWVTVRDLNGPAVGSIHVPNDGQTVKQQSYTEVQGQEVIFNHPEEYQLQPAGKKQPNIIEDYIFKKSAGGNRTGSLTLAVSVYRLQSDKLEEDGSYRIRAEDPDTYVKRISSVNNHVFTIFKKNDGSETVAFIRDGRLVSTIAMSGTLANSNQSETEFTAILNSWQWKK